MVRVSSKLRVLQRERRKQKKKKEQQLAQGTILKRIKKKHLGKKTKNLSFSFVGSV
jgi:hypothetical protein